MWVCEMGAHHSRVLGRRYQTAACLQAAEYYPRCQKSRTNRITLYVHTNNNNYEFLKTTCTIFIGIMAFLVEITEQITEQTQLVIAY